MKKLQFFAVLFLLVATSCTQENPILEENTNAISNAQLSKNLQEMDAKTSTASRVPVPKSETKQVKFDLQDNLVKIDDGDYLLNWNWDTNQPLNKYFSLQMHSDRIVLHSKVYSFTNVSVPELLGDANSNGYEVKYSYDRKTAVLYLDIGAHLYWDDFFSLEVQTIDAIADACDSLRVYGIDTGVDRSRRFIDFPNELYIIAKNHNTGKTQTFEYVQQGFQVEINSSNAYTFTIARTEDLFVRDVIDIDAMNYPWCFIFAKMIHTE